MSDSENPALKKPITRENGKFYFDTKQTEDADDADSEETRKVRLNVTI